MSVPLQITSQICNASLASWIVHEVLQDLCTPESPILRDGTTVSFLIVLGSKGVLELLKKEDRV